jgi:hypothetical protein
MRTAFMFAALGVLAATARADSISVLTPPVGEQAYQLAGAEFANLWQKVTGHTIEVRKAAVDQKTLPAGTVVLIGSDSVHPVVHELIYKAALEGLGLEYGNDNYRLLSLSREGNTYLILAGGSALSTQYAVYDFFRRQAGVEYFWDGDQVPHRDTISLTGLDVLEKPRFRYRGLRYFAHRGLHRFQAEHWDLADWKHEIDWLIKKRFNLFMLRTGIDDLFQRAFPGQVPYPPIDGVDPDAKPRSYDDRTTFWPLKYRGELRKEVLRYARERGLVHPEDTGTITHWYSHTPGSFYKTHPNFPVITDQKTGYKGTSHAIWDIEAEVTWDTYWRLTETHIREYGCPRMFHTIGMAERTFGKDARDNLQRKLYVYRKTQQEMRERYPDAPLLVASWDFLWWRDPDVVALMDQFDPQRTLVLQYTADLANMDTSKTWGIARRFPWIFGIFHSFARNSDIHEDYAILSRRLREAAADPKCQGLVLWSEISHSDTFLLEYLADNSWQPVRLGADKAADRFCQTRYPAALGKAMRPLWREMLKMSQNVNWSRWDGSDTRSTVWMEPQFRLLSAGPANLSPARLKAYAAEYGRLRPSLDAAPGMLKRLAGLAPSAYADELWRRDALDMARTVANQALFVTMAGAGLQMEAWRTDKSNAGRVRRLAELNRRLMAALGDVLAQSDDFSMAASVQRLSRAKPLGGVQPTINSHTEQTLKGNAECEYCRSHHYELVRGAYQPEADALWRWVAQRLDGTERGPWRRPKEFVAQEQTIEDQFYATPLAKLAPTAPRNAGQLAGSINRLATLVEELIAAAPVEK